MQFFLKKRKRRNVKNMINSQQNVSTIVGKFFFALLGTMAMLTVLFLIILISNSLLVLVSQIFQIGNTTKLSSALFNACAGDWINGYSVSEFDISRLGVKEIFGDYTTGFVFPDKWKYNGMAIPTSSCICRRSFQALRLQSRLWLRFLTWRKGYTKSFLCTS